MTIVASSDRRAYVMRTESSHSCYSAPHLFMHSFINSIFNFSASLINVYAKPNTPNANQSTAQDFCHQATPRGNSHTEGPARWNAWTGSKKIAYYNHDRTDSAGSTEYWVWNGPGSEEPGVRFAALLPHFCPVNPRTIDVQRECHADD